MKNIGDQKSPRKNRSINLKKEKWDIPKTLKVMQILEEIL